MDGWVPLGEKKIQRGDAHQQVYRFNANQGGIKVRRGPVLLKEGLF